MGIEKSSEMRPALLLKSNCRTLETKACQMAMKEHANSHFPAGTGSSGGVVKKLCEIRRQGLMLRMFLKSQGMKSWWQRLETTKGQYHSSTVILFVSQGIHSFHTEFGQKGMIMLCVLCADYLWKLARGMVSVKSAQ